jgi:endogenous inhibitor of DNA gyrase (YacG/DUF329 family)
MTMGYELEINGVVWCNECGAPINLKEQVKHDPNKGIHPVPTVKCGQCGREMALNIEFEEI